MKIAMTLYAYLSSEYLLDKGREVGMGDDALNLFSHFEEVKLGVIVDTVTGDVVVQECEGRPLQ